MKLQIKKGTTSKLLDIFIQDSSVTTGAGLIGLVYNSAGLTAYYYREGAASATAITLATMTLGTWATGGFIVIDGTNMPGCYQLSIPDAALTTGANSVIVMLKGATNMAPLTLEIELVDNVVVDAVNRLPSALIGGKMDSSIGAYQSGQDPATLLLVTPANKLATDISNRVTVGSNADKTGYSLTQTFPANFASLSITAAGLVDITQAAADKVWGTTARTLTSFGTLVSDVWSNSTRTLTALSTSLALSIWDVLESAILTASSIGLKIKDNLNATITSRASATDYTSARAANLDNLDGTITSRQPYGDVTVGDYAASQDPGTYVLSTPANKLATDVSGRITVGSNADKGGYGLAADQSGVTVGTVNVLGTQAKTDVKGEVNNALNDASTELAAMPTTASSLRQMLQFIFTYFRNRKTVTATTEILFKEDASTNLGSATISDDGTTFNKGEMN